MLVLMWTFSNHTVPSSVTKNAGVPIEETLKQGQWSNCRTFRKYYYKDTEDINIKYSEGVLAKRPLKCCYWKHISIGQHELFCITSIRFFGDLILHRFQSPKIQTA